VVKFGAGVFCRCASPGAWSSGPSCPRSTTPIARSRVGGVGHLSERLGMDCGSDTDMDEGRLPGQGSRSLTFYKARAPPAAFCVRAELMPSCNQLHGGCSARVDGDSG